MRGETEVPVELDEALKASRHFEPSMSIQEIASLAKPLLSIGNQYGEGWFLAGEMVELLRHGTNNIICIQPFSSTSDQRIWRCSDSYDETISLYLIYLSFYRYGTSSA